MSFEPDCVPLRYRSKIKQKGRPDFGGIRSGIRSEVQVYTYRVEAIQYSRAVRADRDIQ